MRANQRKSTAFGKPKEQKNRTNAYKPYYIKKVLSLVLRFLVCRWNGRGGHQKLNYLSGT